MFRSLFDPNSAFSRGMERVWTLVVLNVLWVLCSLPVVTIGPSTAALYQVLGKVIQGEDSHTARKFFAAWRENFKCALLVWLPMLAVLVLCGFDLYFAVLNDRFLWKLLAVFALQLAAVELTFVFPLMARQNPLLTFYKGEFYGPVSEHMAQPHEKCHAGGGGEPATDAADLADLGGAGGGVSGVPVATAVSEPCVAADRVQQSQLCDGASAAAGVPAAGAAQG